MPGLALDRTCVQNRPRGVMGIRSPADVARRWSTPRPPALLLVVLAALAVLALPAAASAANDGGKRKARSSTECANTDLVPTAENLAAVRAAVLCLHNRERGERGLPPLREHAKLRQAATGHSADMVAGEYFSHDAPGGGDMVERILRHRATRAAPGWSLGENIAYGTGPLATAAADPARVDALPGPPLQHPPAPVPRDRHRDRARRSRRLRRPGRRHLHGGLRRPPLDESSLGTGWEAHRTTAAAREALASAAAVADITPLHALHYDLDRTGGLAPVAAPPYDVIDAAERAALVARSPYNVVEIDLPEDPAGGDPYAHAAATLRAWRAEGVVVARPRARPCGRSSRTTPARTAAAARATGCSRACGSRTTGPAGSARTSARTPARRRTGSASPAPRTRTSRRSSRSTTATRGRRSRRSSMARPTAS